MRIEQLVNVLMRYEPPAVTSGLHMWYDGTLGEYIYKKALPGDGMAQCISLSGGRYLGLITKEELPMTESAAKDWLAERVQQRVSSVTRQEQRAAKAQPKPAIKKPAIKKPSKKSKK